MLFSKKSIAFIFSLSLFLAWTFATYFLEGRILTLHRPEAIIDRFVYTFVANIFIGIVGSIALIRFFLNHVTVLNSSFFGLIGSKRMITGTLIGLSFGVVFFFTQSLPSRHPILLINAYSQVLVVSIAEVIVCWVLVGGSIANMGKNRLFVVFAIIVSSLLFGLYHFGHSPPFNTAKMVVLLSVVGLVTGIFYFLTKCIYGTILFHNFMGIKGVTEALAISGRIEAFKDLQIPIIATAILAVTLLIILDRMYLRRMMGNDNIRTASSA